MTAVPVVVAPAPPALLPCELPGRDSAPSPLLYCPCSAGVALAKGFIGECSLWLFSLRMSVVVALWIAFKHTSCFAQELSSWECLWLYCNLEVRDVAIAALISLLPSPPHLGITEHGETFSLFGVGFPDPHSQGALTLVQTERDQGEEEEAWDVPLHKNFAASSWEWNLISERDEIWGSILSGYKLLP